MMLSISEALQLAHSNFFNVVKRHLQHIDIPNPQHYQRAIQLANIDVKLMDTDILLPDMRVQDIANNDEIQQEQEQQHRTQLMKRTAARTRSSKRGEKKKAAN